jgi:hypothetical protein
MTRLGHPARELPARRAPRRRTLRGLGILVLVTSLMGCGPLLRNPVPPDLRPMVTLPGMLEVRAWAGQVSPAMKKDLTLSFEQEAPADFPAGADGATRYAYLAPSGGGSTVTRTTPTRRVCRESPPDRTISLPPQRECKQNGVNRHDPGV